ncbi:CPD photolyase [Salvelinus namaycush]|uniref:Deoxyribodipyrimidine photo-lyase n=1 Tax=Salvelinus namaycush TaxID=8040 RepID=A0A8U0P963_SALNM|nr:CPD photolyase [Salvelinus namaycush]
MHRSLLLIPASKHIWKFVTLESQRHCSFTKLVGLSSINNRTTMPAEKRKATFAKMDSTKQQKLQVVKEGKGEREEGWPQGVVAEQRKDKDLKFNKKRLRFLSQTQKIKQGSEGVVYWMNRDHRVQDNWALIYAQQLALEEKLPLHICFCLVIPQNSESATIRHFGFMLRGLEEVAKDCSALDIQFHLLQGSAGELLPGFVEDWSFGAVVTDFSPLRTPLQWVEEVKKGLPSDIPFIQVDAHNVVPCWVASDKLEYSARTIRNKITKLLKEFLTEIPLVDKHPHTALRTAKPVDWAEALSSLEVDRTVEEVDWAKSGTAAGIAMLESFIDLRLKNFATQRNNPNSSAVSKLSPWIRFGHLSAQRVVLQVKCCGKSAGESVSSFTEELVVRRELTDNFCFYNPSYDSVKGANDWAQKTLKDHAKDPRPYVYTREQLEKAQTHDKLWNAAQYQMVIEGKMHGFLRMYWAKKILEWTSSPEGALSIAIYLNDRYELDGQDPNGFVGCMWSICGVHDQGWAERPIFGKIRYMNYKGCTRKFDVAQFERKYCPKDL